MRRFKRSVALSVALSGTLLAGSLTLGLPLFLTACQGPQSTASPAAIGSSQFALGGDGSIAFENIPGDNTDPFEAQSVTPAVSSRLHACAKLPYATIGNLLASRGVNLAAVNPKGQLPSAGQVYAGDSITLGTANYAARARENVKQTTSGATRLMDVFLMAAPEIITAMPNVKACQIAGVPTSMFDKNGACTAAGILCLTGAPASQSQVDLCNQVLKDVPGPTGQQIAVAAILSAAHTCE